MESIYLETSIISYLTAKPSRDLRVAAWQQITAQWWEEVRAQYELFTSEIVVLEAGEGDPQAAQKRLDILRQLQELPVDQEVDAIHVAVAGYTCPEICTPQELLPEETDDVPR